MSWNCTHMLQIYQGPFTVCKCEFELSNAQMQKFHQWPEFNNSSVFKCLNNGHRGCKSLQFKTSTIHHWTMFASETTQVEGARADVGPCEHTVSDDERWTATEDGHILFTVFHVALSHTGTVCLSATDNAGTNALPWASRAVFCQPTVSWAHACHAYHQGVIQACVVCNAGLQDLWRS